MPNQHQPIADCSVFSQQVTFKKEPLTQYLLQLTGDDPTKKLTLSLDRTNWSFGKTQHNLLVIGAHIAGSCVPIIWRALGKKGNSNSGERNDLMTLLLGAIPAARIEVLLGDREFIGKKCLAFLKQQKVPFIMRVKDNMVVTLPKGGTTSISRLYKRLRINTISEITTITHAGETYDMQAKQTKKGLIVVFCDGVEQMKNPVNMYRKRWNIECTFACMKRKGFNLEDTNLLHEERLETLTALVVIAMIWCLKIAQLEEPAKTKNHGYKAKSAFMIGKNNLVNALLRPQKLQKYMKIIITINTLVKIVV